MSAPSFCVLGSAWPANGCSNMGWCSMQPAPSVPGLTIPMCTCRGAFVPPTCVDNFFTFYGRDGAEKVFMAVFSALAFLLAAVAVLGCIEHILDIRRKDKPRPAALTQQLYGMVMVAVAGILFGLYWAINPVGLRFGYNSFAALLLPDTALFANLTLLAAIGGLVSGGYLSVALAVYTMSKVQFWPTVAVTVGSAAIMAIASIATLVYSGVSPTPSIFVSFSTPFVVMSGVVLLQFGVSITCSAFILCTVQKSAQATKSNARKLQLRRLAIRTAIVSTIELVAAVAVMLIIFRPSSGSVPYGYFVAINLVLPVCGELVFLLSSIYLFRLRRDEQHEESASTAADEYSRPSTMAEPLIEKTDWH